jgi:alkyl hydroperoxide reductase subunit AhpC
MTLTLGAEAPDFAAETTEGPISFHDWIKGSWCIMFSHPKDFTPVCTTELGAMAHAAPEFARRGVKLIGLSVDPLDSHLKWSADIERSQGIAPNYPIIGDPDLKIAKLYGMLPADTDGGAEGRTAMDNATARCVFIIGPDRKIKLTMTYPMTTGRNVAELLRVVDSLQLTAARKLATPAGWQQGDDVIIVPAVSDAEARERFPDGWTAPLPYLRIVPQPA